MQQAVAKLGLELAMQLVAQINLTLVSCALNTSWGTFELESATGKNST
uniref:Uncharacterized protein n=1 Tax=Vibrio splendidus TaxID=29497 RepID=A0A0H3ZMM0_VIBSP|nr:hypothetical protein [Vibrio splendidus]